MLQRVIDGPVCLLDIAEHHDRDVVDNRISMRLTAHQPTLAQRHTATTTRTDKMLEQPGVDHRSGLRRVALRQEERHRVAALSGVLDEEEPIEEDDRDAQIDHEP